MIPILRRPPPNADGRRHKRPRVGNPVVVIACREGDDPFSAVGLIHAAPDALFVERGSVIQDHISKDPDGMMEKQVVKMNGRQKPGYTDFKTWTPPVAVMCEKILYFAEKIPLKDSVSPRPTPTPLRSKKETQEMPTPPKIKQGLHVGTP